MSVLCYYCCWCCSGKENKYLCGVLVNNNSICSLLIPNWMLHLIREMDNIGITNTGEMPISETFWPKSLSGGPEPPHVGSFLLCLFPPLSSLALTHSLWLCPNWINKWVWEPPFHPDHLPRVSSKPVNPAWIWRVHSQVYGWRVWCSTTYLTVDAPDILNTLKSLSLMKSCSPRLNS